MLVMPVMLVMPGCRGDKGDDSETTGVASTSTTAATTSTTSAGTSVSPTTIGGPGATTEEVSTSASSGSSGGGPPLPRPDASFCPLDWSEPTKITGKAPFGQFDGSVAWFEWQFCNNFYPLVVIVEDGAEVQDLLEENAPIARAVAFSLPIEGWEELAVTGEFQPTVYAMVDGQWTDMNLAQGEATVSASVSVMETESPGGVPRIVGEFSLQGGQGAWDLSGSFDAAYCGRLNDFKPINCD